MKIAISSSLQSFPEESSPGDPMDTQRLGIHIFTQLVSIFPQVSFGLFNRKDFPGMGDAYLALRDEVIKWGADAHVTIHQDAGGGGRGWCILYRNQDALILAKGILAAMKSIPSPCRGVQYRNDVAVLKKPLVSVLIEAGFYTSPEDEAIGVAGWGDPIVRGIANYLKNNGIYPQEKEEDEMIDLELDREGGDKNGFVYVACPVKAGQALRVFADVGVHDFPMNIYIHPISGPSIKKENVMAGGYGNKDNVHGGAFPIDMLYPGLRGEATLVVHAPYRLHGAVG